MGFEVIFKGKNAIRLLMGLGVALRISLISVVISIFLHYYRNACFDEKACNQRCIQNLP